jgi:hypothetical protein
MILPVYNNKYSSNENDSSNEETEGESNATRDHGPATTQTAQMIM